MWCLCPLWTRFHNPGKGYNNFKWLYYPNKTELFILNIQQFYKLMANKKKNWLSNCGRCNDLTASIYVIRFQFDIHYFYFSIPPILSLTFNGSALFVCAHKDIRIWNQYSNQYKLYMKLQSNVLRANFKYTRKRRNGKISL